MSLQNPPTSTLTIPSREQHAALFALINKSRLLNGWMTRTAQELDQTIRAWHEIFAKYAIPLTAYHELYLRAFDARQRKMSAGQDVPTMDATLLVAQWTGDNGLRAEMKQREIDRKRTLGANAASVCRYCHGTGFRPVNPEARMSPFTQCDHSDAE